jgi:hypothetical protein
MRRFLLLLIPSLALAHGGLPVSLSVLRQGETMYVPVFFWGLWIGPDSGPWKWICEEEINDNRTRHYALTTDGAFFATDAKGLTRSIDNGCTWMPVTGEIATLRLSDVAADPSDGMTAWATSDDVMDSADGGQSSNNALFVTHDHGDTFSRVASLDGTDRRFQSIKLSGTTIYVTSGGLHAPFGTAVEASPDGGMTWQHHPINFNVTGSVPYASEIMAIDPRDANTVYIRVFVTATGFDGGALPLQVLLRSSDGGATVTELYRLVGETSPSGNATYGIDGVAVDATRGRVYVATVKGLMMAPDGATSLTPTGGLSQAQCVEVHGDKIYACGSNYGPDFKALARSDDGAQTFTQVLSYQNTVGPIDCPAGTPVGDKCPLYWQMYADQLGINMGIDGGGGSDMGSGGGKGCSCDLSGRSSIPWLMVLLIAGLVPLRRYLLFWR